MTEVSQKKRRGRGGHGMACSPPARAERRCSCCAAAGTAEWVGRCERENTRIKCSLGGGIKRLFDEKKFRGYGPYGYDVKELIAREQAVRMRQRRKPV